MVPIIMLAVGAGGLAIATDSPDAFCPPIDEARQVIAARVGAVTGGAFEARYGMRRDTQTGESLVNLTLRNERQEVLLERNIPVLDGECSDVALALALILERYFTDLAATTSDRAAPQAGQERDETTAPSAEPAEQPSAAPTTPPEPEVETVKASGEPVATSRDDMGAWSVRALVGIGQGAALQMGLGGAFQLKPWWQLSVDTSFQLIRSEVESNGYRVSTIRHAIYASSMFGGALVSHSWWGIGPSVGGQLQIAELVDSSSLGAGAQTRAFVSVGVQGTALWNMSERVQLGVLGRGSLLLGGDEFVVLDVHGTETSVLDLPMLTWDIGLLASFHF